MQAPCDVTINTWESNCPPPPQPTEQINMSKNITFPQLRLRVVNMRMIKYNSRNEQAQGFHNREKIFSVPLNVFSVSRRIHLFDRLMSGGSILSFWQIYNSLYVEMSQYPDTWTVVFHDNMMIRMGKHVC